MRNRNQERLSETDAQSQTESQTFKQTNTRIELSTQSAWQTDRCAQALRSRTTMSSDVSTGSFVVCLFVHLLAHLLDPVTLIFHNARFARMLRFPHLFVRTHIHSLLILWESEWSNAGTKGCSEPKLQWEKKCVVFVLGGRSRTLAKTARIFGSEKINVLVSAALHQ